MYRLQFLQIIIQKVSQKFGNIKINYYLCIAFRPKHRCPHLFFLGEMVEWSITTVLKTVVQRCTGGSNPSLSAEAFFDNHQVITKEF